MTTGEVIRYYGSVIAVAQALGVSRQAVYQWGPRPPVQRQLELAVLTRGALVADQPRRRKRRGTRGPTFEWHNR